MAFLTDIDKSFAMDSSHSYDYHSRPLRVSHLTAVNGDARDSFGAMVENQQNGKTINDLEYRMSKLEETLKDLKNEVQELKNDLQSSRNVWKWLVK